MTLAPGATFGPYTRAQLGTAVMGVVWLEARVAAPDRKPERVRQGDYGVTVQSAFTVLRWRRDPMGELIADLEGVVEATPPQFADQIPSITDIQHFTTRILRRADAKEDGLDLHEVDPTFAGEFAAFRARWPKFYKQDTLDRT